MIAHAFTTKRYFDEVTIPALQRGLDKSGRSRGDVQMFCPVFVVTGIGEAMAAAAAGTRKADRVLRLGRPTARCSNCTAGVNCRPNCTGSRSTAGGTRWPT